MVHSSQRKKYIPLIFFIILYLRFTDPRFTNKIYQKKSKLFWQGRLPLLEYCMFFTDHKRILNQDLLILKNSIHGSQITKKNIYTSDFFHNFIFTVHSSQRKKYIPLIFFIILYLRFTDPRFTNKIYQKKSKLFWQGRLPLLEFTDHKEKYI